MDVNTVISASDLTTLSQRVESFNKTLNQTKRAQNELGKDDFLKILLTQLSHQDPTQPLEDKEFVAQMAQFSALEQITNLSSEMTRVFGLLARGQAVGLLGKTVQIRQGESLLKGVVEAVSGAEVPQILVDGQYYDLSDLETVTME